MLKTANCILRMKECKFSDLIWLFDLSYLPVNETFLCNMCAYFLFTGSSTETHELLRFISYIISTKTSILSQLDPTYTTNRENSSDTSWPRCVIRYRTWGLSLASVIFFVVFNNVKTYFNKSYFLTLIVIVMPNNVQFVYNITYWNIQNVFV